MFLLLNHEKLELYSFSKRFVFDTKASREIMISRFKMLSCFLSN